MMAMAPALWNQLRFNTDQPPAMANLVSGPAGTRPGAVMLGPDTERQFVFADATTLELAQRLARRDVQKMREPPAAPPAHTRAASPPPPPEVRPARPVPRLCKDPARLKRPTAAAAAAAEERRIRQQQQLRRRREEEEAELQRRREQREKERREKAVRSAPVRSRAPHSLHQAQELPARGDSPPVRDTDPQVQEIREQQQQLMGMLNELIRRKPGPTTRRPPPRQAPARQRGYLSETRASKGRQQRPTRRRPCERREEVEEEEEEFEEVEVARPMRLLNAIPGSPQRAGPDSAARRGPPGSARDRTSVLRQQLSQRLRRTPSPTGDPDAVTSRLADLLVDEVIGDTAQELRRSHDSASPLPGYDGEEEVLEPTVDEVDFRLQQIEAEYDAIRARWRCLDYEELPPALEDGMVDSGPLVLDNNAILFTKQPEVVRWQQQQQQSVADKRRLVPRPPTHLAVGLSRAALHSISNARQRYLDWSDDRPGPRFSVELATVADWIGADLVDEALTGAVQDVDRASEDIVNLLLEAEMGGGVGDEEEGSTLADDDDGSASTFESESSGDDD